jgi:hypothetical protein
MHYPNALLSAAHELSLRHNQTCLRLANNRDDTQHIGKAGSVTPRWSASGGSTNLGTHIHIFFMHGDIGQCIGATRERVRRSREAFNATDCTYERLRSDNQRLLALKRFADI